MQSCVSGHCQLTSSYDAKTSVTVSFPLELLTRDYVASVFAWQSSSKVLEIDVLCPGVDVCKNHRCLFCYQAIFCSSRETAVILTILFYLALLGSLLVLTYTVFWIKKTLCSFRASFYLSVAQDGEEIGVRKYLMRRRNRAPAFVNPTPRQSLEDLTNLADASLDLDAVEEALDSLDGLPLSDPK